MRVGIGFDAHRFAGSSLTDPSQNSLVLGGVAIPTPAPLEGHSDADVLTHAIIDALLGAAALGDIGQHFPPSDEQWRGASSIGMLQLVIDRIGQCGWQVGNVDATVIAEQPRITPHVETMRARLASALKVPVERVSVKATTTDRMGFTGRGEGLAAMAIALLEPRKGDES